jgi:beta-mannosidase
MHSWEHRPEGLLIRKAPHMWGWDIMPRLVSAGIWRSVRLESVPRHAIDQLYCWTVDANTTQATLGVFFQVHTPLALNDLCLRIKGVCPSARCRYQWHFVVELARWMAAVL